MSFKIKYLSKYNASSGTTYKLLAGYSITSYGIQHPYDKENENYNTVQDQFINKESMEVRYIVFKNCKNINLMMRLIAR